MVKDFIKKEILSATDLKNEFNKELNNNLNNPSKAQELERLVSEQNDKLYELNKIYEFIEKAEQYQSLEAFGINYAENESNSVRSSDISRIENERQSIALDLHVFISEILNTFADKAEGAIDKIDTDPQKAKKEISTLAKYLRDFITRINDQVIKAQSIRKSNDSTRSISNSEQARSSQEGNRIETLTRREKDVLRAIARGMSNKEIGTSLDISERTVKNHVSNVFKKLEVMDRTQAALFAIRNNFIEMF